MSAQPDPVAARALARVSGDPSRLLDVATLRQFVGADTAVAVLEDAADRAVGAGRPLEDTLIVGPDDAGKQVVARALARDAAQRIVELAHQLRVLDLRVRLERDHGRGGVIASMARRRPLRAAARVRPPSRQPARCRGDSGGRCR